MHALVLCILAILCGEVQEHLATGCSLVRAATFGLRMSWTCQGWMIDHRKIGQTAVGQIEFVPATGIVVALVIAATARQQSKARFRAKPKEGHHD
jgi:hypothetical protein